MVSNQCEYLWQTRGVYSLRRKVQNNVQKHHETPRIVISLKTRNRTSAMSASRSLAAKLDDFWLQMRLSHLDVPASESLV